MAQKNRSKEIWLIPKRVNLHQTICLIDGIIERKYDGTSWNPQKQNNLGVNLKKWGATKDGKIFRRKQFELWWHQFRNIWASFMLILKAHQIQFVLRKLGWLCGINIKMNW